jgi:hypothetical protein
LKIKCSNEQCIFIIKGANAPFIFLKVKALIPYETN